jgi:hypothetical protein
MNEKFYLNLHNVKQNLDEQVEDYYEWILTLANSLQHPTNNFLLNVVFMASLLSYIRMITTNKRKGTLIKIWKQFSFVRKASHMLTIT